MRLVKITQSKSQTDVYINPTAVIIVMLDKSGKTMIQVEGNNTPVVTDTSLADVVNEINDAMK